MVDRIAGLKDETAVMGGKAGIFDKTSVVDGRAEIYNFYSCGGQKS
jgi:hypothetical protein